MSSSTIADLIFQTKNFSVERAPRPFVSREEGGHLRIFPKNRSISCLNDLKPIQAIELIRLESVVREAMLEGMNQQGVPVIWVNLEDLGNWAFKKNDTPVLHIHVFGRANTALSQRWPEAVFLPDRSSGFYDNFQPLNNQDMQVIETIIRKKFAEERFSDQSWRIK